MEPIELREAVRVLVVVWLAVSVVALAVLYAVHLLEQRRTTDKPRKQRDWGR